MFGIGAGEMFIIFIVLLLAIGPDKMPAFFKTVGKGVREFRRTTRELRNQVGLDEMLNPQDLRDPLGMRDIKQQITNPLNQAMRDVDGAARSVARTPRPTSQQPLVMSDEDLAAEQPDLGPDVDFVQPMAPEAS